MRNRIFIQYSFHEYLILQKHIVILKTQAYQHLKKGMRSSYLNWRTVINELSRRGEVIIFRVVFTFDEQILTLSQ